MIDKLHVSKECDVETSSSSLVVTLGNANQS